MPFAAKRLARRVLVVALLFGVWTLVAWWAAKVLIVSSPLNQADAIVVLSGSAVYKERTQLAADCYRKGTANRILLTNDNLRGEWSSEEQRNPFFYERARDQLLALGVPRDRIEVLPQPVTTTFDEAQALRNYAVSRQLRSLLVITSAYHSRRALWTLGRVFAGTGIEIGVQSVEYGEQTPPPLTWWLHLRGWQMVCGEYGKNVYYRLWY